MPLIAPMCEAGCRVSMFIGHDPRQIEASARIGAAVVELHTGRYCDAHGGAAARELERLRAAARLAASLGLEVHTGHGLHYQNVTPIAAIAEIVELNIGHAIIARAVFAGLADAVRDMKALMVGQPVARASKTTAASSRVRPAPPESSRT